MFQNNFERQNQVFVSKNFFRKGAKKKNRDIMIKYKGPITESYGPKLKSNGLKMKLDHLKIKTNDLKQKTAIQSLKLRA